MNLHVGWDCAFSFISSVHPSIHSFMGGISSFQTSRRLQGDRCTTGTVDTESRIEAERQKLGQGTASLAWRLRWRDGGLKGRHIAEGITPLRQARLRDYLSTAEFGVVNQVADAAGGSDVSWRWISNSTVARNISWLFQSWVFLKQH